MARAQLQAQPRELTGNKTRRLRSQGITPAVIYGPAIKPILVQVPTRILQKFLQGEGGETELIEVSVEGEAGKHVVLVQDLQVDPVTDMPVHVDFFEVNLSEPVEVTVPLEFVGEVTAVEEKRGVLLHLLNELEIKVLPTEIPAHIEVDLTKMVEVGDQIIVSDLAVPAGVTILAEAEELVAKIDQLRTAAEEAEVQEAAEKDRAEALSTEETEAAEAAAVAGAEAEEKSE